MSRADNDLLRILARHRRLALALLLAVCSILTLSAQGHDKISTIPQLLFRVHHRRTSAWYLPGGHIQWNRDAYWDTSYELEMNGLDTSRYTCDAIRFNRSSITSRADNTGQLDICIARCERMISVRKNLEAQALLLNSTAAEEVAISTDEVVAILEESFSELAGIRGKRVLIVGDSTDRFFLEQSKFLFGDAAAQFHDVDFRTPTEYFRFQHLFYCPKVSIWPIVRSKAAAEDARSRSRHCIQRYNETHRQPQDELRFDYLFTFGMDEVDLWKDKHTNDVWPSTTSDRMQEAQRLWGGDPAFPTYDLITINFGFWDLAEFQRTNYMRTGRDNVMGLTFEFKENYRKRFRANLAMLRKLYGSRTRIAVRPVHDPRLNSGKWFAPQGMENAPPSQAFAPLRVHQFRAFQLELAAKEGLEVIPFAALTEGLPDGYLADDVHPHTSANVLYGELLLRLLAD